MKITALIATAIATAFAAPFKGKVEDGAFTGHASAIKDAIAKEYGEGVNVRCTVDNDNKNVVVRVTLPGLNVDETRTVAFSDIGKKLAEDAPAGGDAEPPKDTKPSK